MSQLSQAWYKPGPNAQTAHLVTKTGTALMVTACGVALQKTSARKATQATCRCWECSEKAQNETQ